MSALLTFTVLILGLTACGGGSAVEPDPNPAPQGAKYGALADGLMKVKMNPAPVQDPPFTETDLNKAVSSPRELLEQLAPLRSVSFLPEDLLREGGSFDPSLPMSRVMQSGPGDTMATFNPIWEDPTDPLGNAAFAIYRFPLADFGMSSEEQTLGWTWADAIPAEGDLWFGFGNVGENHWDWYAGEMDGVLTVDSYTPYEAGDGTVLCALVVLGIQEVVLEEMQIGAFEIRGTGEEPAEFTPPAPLFPEFPLYFDNTVDLTPGCAPIGDQGSTWMCTAFATANGALNYEMNVLYGDCGWNFDFPKHRASSRFVYNQTGIDLGGSCPTGGRVTRDVAQWLLSNGASSEYNAPIGPVTPSAAYNCGTNWNTEALADAALMRPTQYGFWGSYHPDNGNWYLPDAKINDIKSFIRTVRKPVIFRTDLDANFSAVDYENAGSWTYAGPRTGGHAMLMVGFDDNRNGGSFKVRNSWGTNWGDDGYCWITYDSMKSSTAGVYAAFIKCSYSEAAADRFCPEPPPFLPPLDITFEPDPGVIQFSWPYIPEVTRWLIFRDNMDEPFEILSQKGEEDPVFTDFQVDDYKTHVYWVQAVGEPGTSPMSEPFFLYREIPIS